MSSTCPKIKNLDMKEASSMCFCVSDNVSRGKEWVHWEQIG